MKTTLTQTQTTVFNKVIAQIKYNLQTSFGMGSIASRFVSLSGAAGVGKSFLVAQITRQLVVELNNVAYQNSGDNNICITAPTHRAVQVVAEMVKEQQIEIECKTLHSFLGLLQIYDNDTGEERYILNRKIVNPPRATILIVDESSMVSKSLFNFILEAVQTGRVNTVLFVGDAYQLPPVQEVESLVFRLKQNELTEIVRQAQDSDIIKLATRFRDGIATQNFINLYDNFDNLQSKDIEIFTDSTLFLQDFCKNDQWYNENKIISSYSNNDVDSFNEAIRTYYWNTQGLVNPAYILPNDKLRFKKSFNINSYQNGEEVTVQTATLLYDESLGISYWKCSVLGRDSFFVVDPASKYHFNSIVESYKQEALEQEPDKRKKYWKEYYNLKDSFADVQYIFSSTIHKLQGSTYDIAYIDLKSFANYWMISDNMKYRLAYVAITRAKYKVKILL